MRAYACNKTKFERKSILKYYHLTYIVKHTSQSKRSVLPCSDKISFTKKISTKSNHFSLTRTGSRTLFCFYGGRSLNWLIYL